MSWDNGADWFSILNEEVFYHHTIHTYIAYLAHLNEGFKPSQKGDAMLKDKKRANNGGKTNFTPVSRRNQEKLNPQQMA